MARKQQLPPELPPAYARVLGVLLAGDDVPKPQITQDLKHKIWHGVQPHVSKQFPLIKQTGFLLGAMRKRGLLDSRKVGSKYGVQHTEWWPSLLGTLLYINEQTPFLFKPLDVDEGFNYI